MADFKKSDPIKVVTKVDYCAKDCWVCNPKRGA